nr:MAG TPA: hypothetical protein [Caudoviricetes sp.]
MYTNLNVKIIFTYRSMCLCLLLSFTSRKANNH